MGEQEMCHIANAAGQVCRSSRAGTHFSDSPSMINFIAQDSTDCWATDLSLTDDVSHRRRSSNNKLQGQKIQTGVKRASKWTQTQMNSRKNSSLSSSMSSNSSFEKSSTCDLQVTRDSFGDGSLVHVSSTSLDISAYCSDLQPTTDISHRLSSKCRYSCNLTNDSDSSSVFSFVPSDLRLSMDISHRRRSHSRQSFELSHSNSCFVSKSLKCSTPKDVTERTLTSQSSIVPESDTQLYPAPMKSDLKISDEITYGYSLTGQSPGGSVNDLGIDVLHLNCDSPKNISLPSAPDRALQWAGLKHTFNSSFHSLPVCSDFGRSNNIHLHRRQSCSNSPKNSDSASEHLSCYSPTDVAHNIPAHIMRPTCPVDNDHDRGSVSVQSDLTVSSDVSHRRNSSRRNLETRKQSFEPDINCEFVQQNCNSETQFRQRGLALSNFYNDLVSSEQLTPNQCDLVISTDASRTRRSHRIPSNGTAETDCDSAGFQLSSAHLAGVTNQYLECGSFKTNFDSVPIHPDMRVSCDISHWRHSSTRKQLDHYNGSTSIQSESPNLQLSPQSCSVQAPLNQLAPFCSDLEPSLDISHRKSRSSVSKSSAQYECSPQCPSTCCDHRPLEDASEEKQVSEVSNTKDRCMQNKGESSNGEKQIPRRKRFRSGSEGNNVIRKKILSKKMKRTGTNGGDTKMSYYSSEAEDLVGKCQRSAGRKPLHPINNSDNVTSVESCGETVKGDNAQIDKGEERLEGLPTLDVAKDRKTVKSKLCEIMDSKQLLIHQVHQQIAKADLNRKDQINKSRGQDLSVSTIEQMMPLTEETTDLNRKAKPKFLRQNGILYRKNESVGIWESVCSKYL